MNGSRESQRQKMRADDHGFSMARLNRTEQKPDLLTVIVPLSRLKALAYAMGASSSSDSSSSGSSSSGSSSSGSSSSGSSSRQYGVQGLNEQIRAMSRYVAVLK